MSQILFAGTSIAYHIYCGKHHFQPSYGIKLILNFLSLLSFIVFSVYKFSLLCCSLLLFAAVEFCWNVFPSHIYSSVVLFCVHLIILGGLWISSPEYPYVEKTTDKSTSKKKARQSTTCFLLFETGYAREWQNGLPSSPTAIVLL